MYKDSRPLNRITTTRCTGQSVTKPECQLIYHAGAGSAVWSLGNEAICKVHAWKQGLQSESQTIDFVRENCPSIPVPEVLYRWVDKTTNRSFLVMKSIHARTLDSAWIDLTRDQRLNIAKEVAEHTATLTNQTSQRFESISGHGIGIPSLMHAHDHNSPLHNWFPRTIGPFSSTELRNYMNSISTAPPPDFDDEFVFYHDDQGPTNIVVSDDGNSVAAIIDWANAAYLPPFWVATAPVSVGGFALSFEDKRPYAWAAMLAAELEKHGFHEKISEHEKWRSFVIKQDTERDEVEWSKVRKNVVSTHTR